MEHLLLAVRFEASIATLRGKWLPSTLARKAYHKGTHRVATVRYCTELRIGDDSRVRYKSIWCDSVLPKCSAVRASSISGAGIVQTKYSDQVYSKPCSTLMTSVRIKKGTNAAHAAGNVCCRARGKKFQPRRRAFPENAAVTLAIVELEKEVTELFPLSQAMAAVCMRPRPLINVPSSILAL